jgi:ubiquinone/menaquinone biosynthesis C-methylase UbiE
MPEHAPSAVCRSKEDARRIYSARALWYDWVEGRWEHKARGLGLKALNVRPGESVLEIGPGTGCALEVLAKHADSGGRVYGLDLAEGMLAVARSRLHRARRRAHFIQGDGAHLPVAAAAVDAVFMGFVLELFDTPEIPQVLAECRRVLRPGGRLGAVSLFPPRRPGLALALYEAGHRLAPRLVDCRAIPMPQMLVDAGFSGMSVRMTSLAGLPVAVATARKT